MFPEIKQNPKQGTCKGSVIRMALESSKAIQHYTTGYCIYTLEGN